MPIYEYKCTQCKEHIYTDTRGKMSDSKEIMVDCVICRTNPSFPLRNVKTLRGEDGAFIRVIYTTLHKRILSTGITMRYNFSNKSLNKDGL